MRPIHPDIDPFLARIASEKGDKARDLVWIVLDHILALYPLATNSTLPDGETSTNCTFLTNQTVFLAARFLGIGEADTEYLATQAMNWTSSYMREPHEGMYSPVDALPFRDSEETLH